MSSTPFLSIQNINYAYADRKALVDFSLDLAQGEIFGLLGPNGGGKSTLFKLLTTLRPLQEGEIVLKNLNYRTDQREIRNLIGSIFQSPALDKKLTVAENLWHQGKLFNLSAHVLEARIQELTQRFGLKDRLKETVEKLSGGLQRRVEIAKALLHQPEILVMDEPSTGLDPGIRLELWDYLQELRAKGLTILLTTHLLEEAERCDRIALIHEGHLITQGKPSVLCESLGGQVLTITTDDTATLISLLQAKLELTPKLLGISVRVRIPATKEKSLISSLASELADHPNVQAITLSRPSLADLYLEKTGKSWSKMN